MKPTSREILEEISNHCYILTTRYRYARTPTWSEKYAEGQLAALEYIGRLCLYFLEQDGSVPDKFKAEILKQIDTYSSLNDSDYKKGLYDALNDITIQLNSLKK